MCCFLANYQTLLRFQQRVESVALFVGRDEDTLKEVDQVRIPYMHKGGAPRYNVYIQRVWP